MELFERFKAQKEAIARLGWDRVDGVLFVYTGETADLKHRLFHCVMDTPTGVSVRKDWSSPEKYDDHFPKYRAEIDGISVDGVFWWLAEHIGQDSDTMRLADLFAAFRQSKDAIARFGWWWEDRGTLVVQTNQFDPEWDRRHGEIEEHIIVENVNGGVRVSLAWDAEEYDIREFRDPWGGFIAGISAEDIECWLYDYMN